MFFGVCRPKAGRAHPVWPLNLVDRQWPTSSAPLGGSALEGHLGYFIPDNIAIQAEASTMVT